MIIFLENFGGHSKKFRFCNFRKISKKKSPNYLRFLITSCSQYVLYTLIRDVQSTLLYGLRMYYIWNYTLRCLWLIFRKTANLCSENVCQQPYVTDSAFNNMVEHDVLRLFNKKKNSTLSPMLVTVQFTLNFPSHSLFTIIFNFIVIQP